MDDIQLKRQEDKSAETFEKFRIALLSSLVYVSAMALASERD